MSSHSLVLVESPAKCKKIESYLGPGYKCIATMGHLRELPSLSHIDIANHFATQYVSVDEKRTRTLLSHIAAAREVILATDADREGEAIAWHICDLAGLSPDTVKRIVFREITEGAIQHAILHPGRLDMQLVRAQQTRQIVDMLVGFKVSPTLWTHIARKASLSAGRCQTPALRLVYDNYIERTRGERTYGYDIVGHFTSMQLPFRLMNVPPTQSEVEAFVATSHAQTYTFSRTEPVVTHQSAPLPLTTSRLQQVASNELRLSPKDTMGICQNLYEYGYITYMRTDSMTYSQEFLRNVNQLIRIQYGEAYVQQQDHSLQPCQIVQNEDGQLKEAHEAIRPTNLDCNDVGDANGVVWKHRKTNALYKLIWRHSVESCMTAAQSRTFTARVSTERGDKYELIAKETYFLGWKKVRQQPTRRSGKSNHNEDEGYSDGDGDGDDETNNCACITTQAYSFLSRLTPDSVLSHCGIVAKMVVRGIKPLYTEARLVRLLEERGIGRPSTFATLVDKIQERKYVRRERHVEGVLVNCQQYTMDAHGVFSAPTFQCTFGDETNKLVIQPMGILVMEFLDKHFSSLFQYDFTRQMEDTLDAVAMGQANWEQVCIECNATVDALVASLGNANRSKFDSHTHTNTDTHTTTKWEHRLDATHTCIVGSDGKLLVKCTGGGAAADTTDNDGTGASASASASASAGVTFKSVAPNIDVKKLQEGGYRTEEVILPNNETKAVCVGSYESQPVYVKQGKFGLYMQWNDRNISLRDLGHKSPDSVTFSEIEPFLVQGPAYVRTVTANTSIRTNTKNGSHYVYHKTPTMKKPMFCSLASFSKETHGENYNTCDLSVLRQWLADKHKVFT